MARGLVGSRRRNPCFWRVARWAWTVDVEARPTASQISRTDGGYPRSRWVRSMKSRTSRRFPVNGSSVTPHLSLRLVLACGVDRQGWRRSSSAHERAFGLRYSAPRREANICSTIGLTSNVRSWFDVFERMFVSAATSAAGSPSGGTRHVLRKHHRTFLPTSPGPLRKASTMAVALDYQPV